MTEIYQICTLKSSKNVRKKKSNGKSNKTIRLWAHIQCFPSNLYHRYHSVGLIPNLLNPVGVVIMVFFATIQSHSICSDSEASAHIWSFIENQLLTPEHWFYKNSPVYLWSDDRLSPHFSIYWAGSVKARTVVRFYLSDSSKRAINDTIVPTMCRWNIRALVMAVY